MKKSLILFSVAALALVSCAKVSDKYVGAPESREIAFQAVAQTATKAALNAGDAFPNQSIWLSAYSIVGENKNPFFLKKEFVKEGETTIWAGKTATDKQYWPLSACTINFLGCTGVDNANVTFGTNYADDVTIIVPANNTTQSDVMYAIGTGSVTKTGNAVTYPGNIGMTFKHTQAWVNFTAKTAADYNGAITITSIVLDGGKYNGTYKAIQSNYNAVTGQTVAGSWTATGDVVNNVTVPGISSTVLSTSSDASILGSGLMVVPGTDAITGFKVNYTINGIPYVYDYVFDDAPDMTEGTKYIYNIIFTLNEIKIVPSITAWGVGGSTNVTVPTTPAP